MQINYDGYIMAIIDYIFILTSIEKLKNNVSQII